MPVTEFSRSIAFFFLALLAWQIIAAFVGGWGTLGQITAQGKRGMAVVQHGSIWVSALYLWWVMGTIWYRYANVWWSNGEYVGIISGIVGVLVMIAMVIVWKTGNQMEAHQQTTAGLPLAIQLGCTIAILCAFFVFTKDVPSDFALLVAVLMFAYVFVSAHLILEALRPVNYEGRPSQDPTTWYILGATFVALAVGYVGQQNKWWGWWETY